MRILIIFAWVPLLVIVLAIFFYMRGYRVASCATILRHLELIMRQNLPLPVALQLAAQSERGATRRVLFRCGQLTQLGMPLTDALRRAYPKCPGTVMSVIAVSERAGTLPAALHEWAPRLERAYTDREFQSDGSRFGYSLATWLTFLLILTGVGYYVIPKFRTIAYDFDVPLSDLTLDVLSNPFNFEVPRTWPGWVLRVTAFATLGLIFVFARWARFRIFKRKPERLSSIDRFTDWLAWTVSPFRSVTRANAWGQALPSIRLATVAGSPLDDAIFQAAQLDVNSQLRALLMEWSLRLKTGESPVAAAHAVHAPGMLTRWLAVGMRDGTFESSLLFAERYYVALASRRGNLVLQILWPMVMFFLACMTGLVLYSMIHVLQAILEKCISFVE